MSQNRLRDTQFTKKLITISILPLFLNNAEFGGNSKFRIISGVIHLIPVLVLFITS